MKTQKMLTAIVLVLLLNIFNMQAQERVKLGIISMDTKGLIIDNETMTNMVHLELEKANVYEVMDKYDIAEIVKQQGINVNECFGKTCLVRVGKILKADMMLTGSAEKFGNKIIFIFRLIDVKQDRIVKTDVMEFIDQQDQLQIMVRMCINNIIGKENDRFLIDLLVNYDQPITSYRTTLSLNGPRIGALYTFGDAGKRMNASKSQGGFDMFAVTNILGYQFEKQFLTSGDFQALFEFIPAINGLESGVVIPSVTALLGFRFNQSGFELGIGPVFRIVKEASGYFDENGNWILKSEVPFEFRDDFDYQYQLDSRGAPRLSSGMIFAVGKTFRSGYLNMPVNLYVNPRKNGTIVGLIFGFNVAKGPQRIIKGDYEN